MSALDTEPSVTVPSYILTHQKLTKLLREAEVAHEIYEEMLGHDDENWPSWYATYILQKLEKSLND